MRKQQYTAENEDYEADRERIRSSRRRRKARKRRAKRIALITRLGFRLALIAVGCWICFTLLRSNALLTTMNDEHEIPAPVHRTEEEVLEALSEKAGSDKTYAAILEHSEEYPSAMLAALANNPEMLDFAAGYLDYDTTDSKVSLTKKEKKEAYPLFLQWDSRWGYDSYGTSNIGVSGCGPTCLSMVVYALTREESATPDQIASYAEQAGYYIEGTGTAWALMTEGASHFGITGTEMSLDEDLMKTRLDQGHPIICAMRSGDFTVAGHFIMIYGYEKKGFLVNDPNCISRSHRLWDYETLQDQIKDLWYFSYE